MAKILLHRLVTGAALLSLSACVYASPYPAAFELQPTADGRGISRIKSAAELCQTAHLGPSNLNNVYACLRARGRDWDVRGRAIRTQASVVGQAAIPIGIASFGLAAGNDRSDFGALAGGGTTAALAHSGAYARPDQARVYELATAAYRCLESAVGDWNSADQVKVDTAYESLNETVSVTLTYLDSPEVRAQIDPAEILASKAEIRRQRASAQAAKSRLGGDVGSELLRRSGEIENQVREAIGARLPDPQVVAASLVRPATGNPVDTPSNTPPPAAHDLAQALPNGPRLGVVETDEQRRARLAAEAAVAAAAAAEKKRVVDTVRTLMAAINTRAEEFDAEANAYKATTRAMTVDCAFNPVSVPALIDPGDITLNAAHQGSFLMQGGVPPYGYTVLPRDGLSITVQPIGSGWRFDLSASAAGPWTVYVYDASSVNRMIEVKVSKP